jgi:hypothetical protein
LFKIQPVAANVITLLVLIVSAGLGLGAHRQG